MATSLTQSEVNQVLGFAKRYSTVTSWINREPPDDSRHRAQIDRETKQRYVLAKGHQVGDVDDLTIVRKHVDFLHQSAIVEEILRERGSSMIKMGQILKQTRDSIANLDLDADAESLAPYFTTASAMALGALADGLTTLGASATDERLGRLEQHIRDLRKGLVGAPLEDEEMQRFVLETVDDLLRGIEERNHSKVEEAHFRIGYVENHLKGSHEVLSRLANTALAALAVLGSLASIYSVLPRERVEQASQIYVEVCEPPLELPDGLPDLDQLPNLGTPAALPEGGPGG